MQHYGQPATAHINLPGMNVLVKRASDNAFDAKAVIPLRLDPIGDKINVTTGGTRRDRLKWRLRPNSVDNRHSCNGYDAVVLLPKSVEQCTWTQRTLVQHEAYELLLPLKSGVDPLINLPGWPTLLLCHDSREPIVRVSCRSEVMGLAYRATHSRVLNIGKGAPRERGQRRLRRMNFSSKLASAGLVDGFAAVVRVPRGTTVRTYSNTPLENGTPGGSVRLIVE